MYRFTIFSISALIILMLGATAFSTISQQSASNPTLQHVANVSEEVQGPMSSELETIAQRVRDVGKRAEESGVSLSTSSVSSTSVEDVGVVAQAVQTDLQNEQSVSALNFELAWLASKEFTDYTVNSTESSTVPVLDSASTDGTPVNLSGDGNPTDDNGIGNVQDDHGNDGTEIDDHGHENEDEHENENEDEHGPENEDEHENEHEHEND